MCQRFLKEIIIDGPLAKVKYYAIRTEFKFRGSPYTLVHEVLFSRIFFRAFYFRAPPFFHFRENLIFTQRQKKVWFCQTKTSQMLVFCWYLVRERKKIKICLLRIEKFYFRALLVARITLIRTDYIFAQEHCAKIKLTRKFHELRYSFINFMN